MTEKEKEFITKYKYFTTTDMTKEGIDKSLVKREKDILELSTLPTKYKRLERHYAYAPELKRMVKYATKLAKKTSTASRDEELVAELVDKIERTVRDIMGFPQDPTKQGETNE
jgi:hypothetical protein